MEGNLALKEIQLRLGVPQHVLIHLCEKGVIEPDVTDTAGRGKWRRFSTRNLFEFAVALELRKYQIPITVVGAIIKLLGSFERSAQRSLSHFELPASITGSSPHLILYIYDGETLVFKMGEKGLFAFNLAKALEADSGNVRVEKLDKLPSKFRSYLTVNLSELAREITN